LHLVIADFVKITKVVGRQILDSRGNPTVEVDITLDNGFMARAAVPSGASTGEFEACELRDGNKKVYLGKGVLKAVEAVNGPIAKLLKGKNPLKQRELDDAMIALDGTANKSKLGANALLGASMAITVAAANVSKMPLWKYIAKLHKNKEFSLPTPMANIINGGKHADNMIDFQEFMIMPVGAKTFSEGLQWITEVFHALKSILKKGGHVTAVGDEGGFAPNLTNDQALEVHHGGHRPRATSPASRSHRARLRLVRAVRRRRPQGLQVLEVESGQAVHRRRNDRHLRPTGARSTRSFRSRTVSTRATGKATSSSRKALGKKVQIVGDDFFVTNPVRLKKGIDMGACNAILIKVNQIGTVTETLDAIKMAQKAGYGVISSHRSGETEDSFIADLAVGTSAGQIKTGSLSRTDRICKYNQLIRIEEQLGAKAIYKGLKSIKGAGF
jgi:enolase